jgi:hypothetical protein
MVLRVDGGGVNVSITCVCMSKDFWYKGEIATTKFNPSEAALNVHCLRVH